MGQPNGLLLNSSPEKSLVRKLIKQTGLSKKELSSQLGMSRQGVEYHLAGEGTISPKIYKRLKGIIEVAGADILGDVRQVGGNFYPITKSFPNNEITETVGSPEISGYCFFPYNNTEKCFAVINSGDAMVSATGKSINDQDILLIDASQEIFSGDIVLVKFTNGRQLIRQYFEQDGTLIFRALNEKYPDLKMQKEDVEKIARACMKQSRSEML